jgi:hypothetical protein
VLLLAAAVLAGGCSHGRAGGDRSVLDEGSSRRMLGGVHHIGAAEARRDVAQARANWTRELRRRAAKAPAQRFTNLDRATLRRRLDGFARRYGFLIVSVRFLQPRQLAPAIVVRTTHYRQLARATAAILKRIDPHAAVDDRRGWRYEGFWFEADDERGVPFLVAFNFWRGSGGGGGQWARSEPLYPFAHG